MSRSKSLKANNFASILTGQCRNSSDPIVDGGEREQMLPTTAHVTREMTRPPKWILCKCYTPHPLIPRPPPRPLYAKTLSLHGRACNEKEQPDVEHVF